MKPHEPMTTWLPTTEQIMMAPERAILAALDSSLALAIRVLKAEHIGLFPGGRRSRGADYEPLTATLLPVAEAMVICSEHLRRLLKEYRCLVDGLLADAERSEDDEGDIDIPF